MDEAHARAAEHGEQHGDGLATRLNWLRAAVLAAYAEVELGIDPEQGPIPGTPRAPASSLHGRRTVSRTSTCGTP